MYSDKRNCNILTAKMLSYGIRKVVVCPGSRNAVLVHNFAEAGMELYQVTDERSAAFLAIGLIEAECTPVAVCCTSGSALLNTAPAVSEAFYHSLPLLIISADRPQCWIGQMDGQTIRQPEALTSVVGCSVQLPEVTTDDEAWYCERLMDEAIIKMNRLNVPSHINVSISEPLFNFNVEKLPVVKSVEYRTGGGKVSQFTDLFDMVIIGQLNPDDSIREAVRKMTRNGIVVLAEQLANVQGTGAIGEFDRVLSSATEEELKSLRPMSVAYVGGHIVSKSLKNFIRNHPPRMLCRVTTSVSDLPDTFKCVTSYIESSPKDFLCSLAEFGGSLSLAQSWREAVESLPVEKFDEMSDLDVISRVASSLSDKWTIQVANSTAVRALQRVSPQLPNPVFCNRGVNGIDGSVSTAVGYWASGRPTLLITGDLSFFYDSNALFCGAVQKRVTDAPLIIVLLNNGGGSIFRSLKGLDASPYMSEYIAGKSSLTAEGIARAAGVGYVSVKSSEKLKKKSEEFMKEGVEELKGVEIIEVFTKNRL